MVQHPMFQPGDVIWARLDGFPWWPSYITLPEPGHLKSLKISKIPSGRHLVWFFNDNDRYCLLPESKMRPWDDEALQGMAASGKMKQDVLAAYREARDWLEKTGMGDEEEEILDEGDAEESRRVLGEESEESESEDESDRKRRVDEKSKKRRRSESDDDDDDDDDDDEDQGGSSDSSGQSESDSEDEDEDDTADTGRSNERSQTTKRYDASGRDSGSSGASRGQKARRGSSECVEAVPSVSVSQVRSSSRMHTTSRMRKRNARGKVGRRRMVGRRGEVT